MPLTSPLHGSLRRHNETPLLVLNVGTVNDRHRQHAHHNSRYRSTKL